MTEAFAVEVAEGTRLLGVAPDDDPATIVAAVDAFVYAWQCGDRPPQSVLDAEDAPFTLGAVWGEQFVRRFGWEWRMVTFFTNMATRWLPVCSRPTGRWLSTRSIS
jgi:hypothetical protein